jgi:radical SAM protein with 4Fe4S-binding SPASM domain
MDLYIRFAAREKAIPLRGTFELTPLCNLNCKMCYVHMSADLFKASGKKLLTGTQWKHIMSQAVDAGMLYSTLTGGEALSHPDFNEIFQYLQSQGVSITLKSNGLLLDEERMAYFAKHPPQGIQMTLYGSDDETYEKVTGRRCFQNVIDAIKRVNSSGIPLHVSITPNRYMLGNIGKTLALLEDMGVDYGINSSLIQPREETGRALEDSDLTLDEYIDLYKENAAMRNQLLTPVCAEDIPNQPTSAAPMVGLPCSAGRNSFSVHWDGRMYPCLSLPDVGADLTVVSFPEAWNAVHEAVRQHPFPGECMTCKLRPLCPPCVVEHAPNGYAEHANPAICEKAKRLFQEGLINNTNIKEDKQNEETV